MTSMTLVYALAALVAVLAPVVLALRVIARFKNARPSIRTRLEVVERRAIDPRRRLLLIRCDQREVLILTGSSDLVVGWLDPAASAS